MDPLTTARNWFSLTDPGLPSSSTVSYCHFLQVCRISMISMISRKKIYERIVDLHNLRIPLDYLGGTSWKSLILEAHLKKEKMEDRNYDELLNKIDMLLHMH